MRQAPATLPGRRYQGRSGRQLDFSALGFGSAPLGNLYRPIPNRQALDTLEAAWAGGVRYFDTAPLYGYGLAEVRVGSFLRERPRGDFLLSTKVGRILRRTDAQHRDGIGKFFDVPSREVVYDYSYDGVLRCFETSFERLGLDRVDISLCHDIDIFTHGSAEASARRTREFLDGGLRALSELRSQGVVDAIGIGVNEWQVCETVARNSDVDLFLLAGRYTLLEQEALDSFLPLCQSRGMGVVIGGPFNSGVLASGAKPDACFNYAPAPEPVLRRVREIERVCQAHGVALRDAALQFPLMHPAVVSVIPGAITTEEVRGNVASMAAPIPDALWQDLRREGLLRADAPIAPVQDVARVD
ncbi:aldo/keto reductase [Verminephrobacter aporrectodeae subsp. tuberculatae]|uniref:Aldo/keto reductase n=1 Tax=Verminephrobacter aporrectodeae subsp. tuberculatae TaxID=1110392 RepID=A0ABT3KYH2_9BURK|nr:aldo/keto reductase [Verminephrobacter aporrectodeae]MCW5323365.1 aldo/keto reductase [Verminephrobacter aporrectodeae subsp. tuberculatae]